MSRFLSERFQSLEPYVPGEQPSDRKYIRLNTNESPYPPPPEVMDAVTPGEIAALNLYPSHSGADLIAKLAEAYNVLPENLIIGNGSDELLAFSFLAFGDKERGICFPDVTYGFYSIYASLFGVPAEQIPLRDDLTINPADYFGKNKNIVIANPNAPTCIALPLGDIEAIIKSNPDHIVLIDEAYVDFGGESAIPLIHKYDNLLVMHTFSKSRFMAGARLACAIASAPIIADLTKMKYSFNPYNVNHLSQVMGEAALSNEAYYREMRHEIIETRKYTEQALRELGFSMTESSTNFIFATHPAIGGFDFYTALKDRGVLIRHFNKPRISEYLRITIGTRAEMEGLIEAVTVILAEGA